MTGRATFGEFLQAARRHLVGGTASWQGSPEEVSRSLLWVVGAIGRHLRDMTEAYDGMTVGGEAALDPWAHASLEARDAVANASAYLHEHRAEGRLSAVPPASHLARRLDAVAVSLTAGRDLLQTHFAPAETGGRLPRSEWAAVIISASVRRALLDEFGSLARRIAHHAANVALSPSPGVPASAGTRRNLNAACQWLWAFDTFVQAAQQREPLAQSDRELLAAIPANTLPERRAPTGNETVAEIADGVITTAERIRHMAWRSAQQDPWSPSMTVTSWRRVAETSTATSHHCRLILQTLATGKWDGELAAQLAQARSDASRAYRAWLTTARDLRQVNTEARGYLTPAAAEAADLTLWTGRLAYADPHWELTTGPTAAARALDSLITAEHDLPAVTAAVHYTSQTLNELATAERERIRTAARSGRILVATRTLPDDYDIPRPFARAPRQRVIHLLSRYRETAQETRKMTDRLGDLAVATSSSSRVLTAARAALSSGRIARAVDGREHDTELKRDASSHVHRDVPGPVERTLNQLGIDSPDLLARGIDLDRAAERLLVHAAEIAPKRPTAAALNQSTATAALVNRAVASAEPRALSLLAPPRRVGQQPMQAEQPELEP